MISRHETISQDLFRKPISNVTSCHGEDNLNIKIVNISRTKQSKIICRSILFGHFVFCRQYKFVARMHKCFTSVVITNNSRQSTYEVLILMLLVVLELLLVWELWSLVEWWAFDIYNFFPNLKMIEINLIKRLT